MPNKPRPDNRLGAAILSLGLALIRKARHMNKPRMTFRPNWQTYKVERLTTGLRRYHARSTYVAVNGARSEHRTTFTRKGAERWIARLRKQQSGRDAE